jgi:ABC-type Mn2+/Zn2+ transport system permease subunit
MDWLTEPFRFDFMLRALLAGFLVAAVTSIVGTWVVLRGLSFIGDALAHGVLPGIAVAVLFGFSQLLGAVASALVMVWGIGVIHRRARLSEDTGIGLLFVGMLGLGVVIISRTSSYAGSLAGILFGDALGVQTGDLRVLAVGLLVTLVTAIVFYRPFLALSFNEDKAKLLGMRPAMAQAVLLGLVTLAVVIAFKTVGTLLVFGLLIAPPATASLVTRRVPSMMLVAVGVGALAVVGGLYLSYYAGTAAGATMATLSVFLFFVVLAIRGIATRSAG